MTFKILFGLLGVAGIVLVLQLASSVVDETSDWLASRLGVLTIRAATLGRYPRRPLSQKAEVLSAVLGVFVLVALVVLIIYVVATV
ncbi:MAG: hypothetical protein OER90_03070 [Gemmatimonadota bacterium]|nr:hypothetical protein [Gemmatimonadota bacterium]